jgi:choline kinase
MRAVILAAGVGWRLSGGDKQPPKCLLRFDGQSLLERHVRALEALGIGELFIGVGFRADDVERELTALRPAIAVHTVFNPHYREGNIVTLHTLSHAMCRGGAVLLMDADVLYHFDVLRRLIGAPHENCFALDRELEPGEEPVKLCLSRQRVVAFGKQIPAQLAYDTCGEWVGFLRLQESMAKRLAARAAEYLASGRREAYYEEAISDLLAQTPQAFGCEDVTGIPWIEIDFQADVERAEREVMARIRARELA